MSAFASNTLLWLHNVAKFSGGPLVLVTAVMKLRKSRADRAHRHVVAFRAVVGQRSTASSVMAAGRDRAGSGILEDQTRFITGHLE